jgi:hypothetical protein
MATKNAVNTSFSRTTLSMPPKRKRTATKKAKTTATGKKALKIITMYGGIDGEHHKQWVLDQVVRSLTGPDYSDWVKNYEAGRDGPKTYMWEEGIAP